MELLTNNLIAFLLFGYVSIAGLILVLVLIFFKTIIRTLDN